MSIEIVKDIEIECVMTGDRELISVHVVKSPGTNPPHTIHYDLHLVVGPATFVLPGVRDADLSAIADAIKGCLREAKKS